MMMMARMRCCLLLAEKGASLLTPQRAAPPPSLASGSRCCACASVGVGWGCVWVEGGKGLEGGWEEKKEAMITHKAPPRFLVHSAQASVWYVTQAFSSKTKHASTHKVQSKRRHTYWQVGICLSFQSLSSHFCRAWFVSFPTWAFGLSLSAWLPRWFLFLLPGPGGCCVALQSSW